VISASDAVTSTLLFPHAPMSVYDARQAVRRDLVDHGVPAPACDAAVLVVSEILSNALKHARPLQSGLQSGKVALSWAVGDDAVRVAVRDGGSPTRPRLGTAPASATGGRGLSIVRELADDWGVSDEAGETVVWAVVPCAGSAL